MQDIQYMKNIFLRKEFSTDSFQNFIFNYLWYQFRSTNRYATLF